MNIIIYKKLIALETLNLYTLKKIPEVQDFHKSCVLYEMGGQNELPGGGGGYRDGGGGGV